MLCLQGEHDTLACVFTIKNGNISQISTENPTCPWSVILGEETATCLDELAPPNCDSLSTLLPPCTVLLHVTHLKCVLIPSTLRCVGELCFQLDGVKPEFLHFQNTLRSFSYLFVPRIEDRSATLITRPDFCCQSQWVSPKIVLADPGSGRGEGGGESKRKTSYPWLYYPSTVTETAKQITDLWQFKRTNYMCFNYMYALIFELSKRNVST